jgi:hypothetical protein
VKKESGTPFFIIWAVNKTIACVSGAVFMRLQETCLKQHRGLECQRAFGVLDGLTFILSLVVSHVRTSMKPCVDGRVFLAYHSTAIFYDPSETLHLKQTRDSLGDFALLSEKNN